MDEADLAFLKHRNDSLLYALQYLDGAEASEEDIFNQSERFFNFIVGERPKRKRAKVIKLVSNKDKI